MNNIPTNAKPLITRSKVKRYALKVSKERRAGKFTRVSEAFLQSVETDLDSAIRQLVIADLSEVPSCEEVGLVTGGAVAKSRERLELLARLITYRKVMRHPSVGTTLQD